MPVLPSRGRGVILITRGFVYTGFLIETEVDEDGFLRRGLAGLAEKQLLLLPLMNLLDPGKPFRG